MVANHSADTKTSRGLLNLLKTSDGYLRNNKSNDDPWPSYGTISNLPNVFAPIMSLTCPHNFVW